MADRPRTRADDAGTSVSPVVLATKSEQSETVKTGECYAHVMFVSTVYLLSTRASSKRRSVKVTSINPSNTVLWPCWAMCGSEAARRPDMWHGEKGGTGVA